MDADRDVEPEGVVPAPQAVAPGPVVHAPASRSAALLALQRTAGNRVTRAYVGAGKPDPLDDGGVPTGLRSAIEQLSGRALDGVEVHYASREPSRVQALAFTRGDDIHLGPGQERLLGHEAWHVVQQRAGRVAPTIHLGGHAINEDPALEREADAMGRRAGELQARPPPQGGAHAQAAPAAPATAVMQGDWVDSAKMHERVRDNPIEYLYQYASRQGALLSTYRAQVELLGMLRTETSENATVRKTVQDYLQDSFDSGELFTTPGLLTQVSIAASDPDQLLGQADDHAEDRPPGPEIEVTFENFGEYIDKPAIPALDEGLYNVFAKLAVGIGKTPTPQIYAKWYSSGVLTRSGFAALFETGAVPMEQEATSQMARTPNTLSYKDQYQTYNFGKFVGVTYQLDGEGNIEFDTAKKATTWKKPSKPNSFVDLEKGGKKAGHGLMRNGNVVKIVTASRAQHFAIANRIKGITDAGSPPGWTWHHLSDEYEMVLVDRRVHQKHGHNGGVYIWT